MFRTVRSLPRAGSALLSLLAVVLLAGCGADQYPQTIFEPVTQVARDINDLQATIFWWTMLVLAVVIIALLVILVRFRDREGAPEPKRVHGNNTLEILWTLGPAIIVVLILIPTVRMIFDTYRIEPEDALQVEAIGHQWWWEFNYPELGITTANQLHLPIDREVQVTISSADVLHNFWVPRLHGKRYAYPAWRGAESSERENFNTLLFSVEEPGSYLGQCAEFCGTSHALMRLNVVAVAPDDFEDWTEAMAQSGVPGEAGVADDPEVEATEEGTMFEDPEDAAEAVGDPDPREGATGADQPSPSPEVPIVGDTAGVDQPGDPDPAAHLQTPPGDTAGMAATEGIDSDVQRGYELFTTNACAACHAIEGVSQGRLGPDLTRFGDRWAVGAGLLPNTEENVARWITDPQSLKPGAKMPGTDSEGGGMPPTGLGEDEVRAITAYLRSLK